MNSDQPTIFKLTNGEEIIVTDFVIIDSKYLVVSNPYSIQKSIEDGGYANIYLFKWMSYASDETFPIDISFILTYNTPNQKLYDYYLTCLKEEFAGDDYRSTETSNTKYH